jgi:voltage-gated potassium channel
MKMTLSAYKAKSLWPMVILATFFLILYLFESFRTPIAQSNPNFFTAMNFLLWGIFAIDYIVMLFLSRHKFHFFRTHLLDLALVIFPLLRPLRALRLVVIFERALSGVQRKLYINIPIYVGVAATLIVLIGGGAIFNAEIDEPDGNIKSPSDALWWAAVTVTTVGYGDRFPVTAEGRWIAVGLMITGIAVVGSVTASLAAWIVEKVNLDNSKNKP